MNKKAASKGKKARGKVSSKTKKSADKKPAIRKRAQRIGVESLVESTFNLEMVVARVIAAQLQIERHWPPINMNKLMGRDYNYADTPVNTIGLFLNAVRLRLAHGVPALLFQFDAKFAKAALAKSVGPLTIAVARATKVHGT